MKLLPCTDTVKPFIIYLLLSMLSKVTSVLTVQFEISYSDLAFRNSEDFPYEKSEPADLCLHGCLVCSSRAALKWTPTWTQSPRAGWIDRAILFDSFPRGLNCHQVLTNLQGHKGLNQQLLLWTAPYHVCDVEI